MDFYRSERRRQRADVPGIGNWFSSSALAAAFFVGSLRMNFFYRSERRKRRQKLLSVGGSSSSVKR